MKVLLDECLPRKLAELIDGHECTTVTKSGWSGLTNGELLKTAQSKFDVFLTVDQNLPSQQNLSLYSIGIMVLRSKSNDIEVLKAFVPTILRILAGGPFAGVKFADA